MDLSITIVNYNSLTKALKCLESVYASDLEGVDFEVIFIDNASAEPVENMIREKFTKIIFIQSERNLGMGGGNNLGMRTAQGRYILVLNPDTELRSHTLKTMIAYLDKHDDVGLVGPKLLYPDGTRQDSCYRFPRFLMPFMRRTFLGRFYDSYLDYYLMKDVDLNVEQEVDWIMGSCLLIRKEVLDKVGLFDERFFMYFEDTDLCKRIKLAGWKNVYLPAAEVVHHHGRASAKKHWFLAPFINRLSRVHIISWIKYFLKWKFK